MLQVLLKTDKRGYNVRGSKREPTAPLKGLSKETEDRDSGVRVIGLDMLHKQPPIRIEHLRLLMEDRRSWRERVLTSMNDYRDSQEKKARL